MSTVFRPIKFGILGFVGGGKPDDCRKSVRARTRTNNKLNSNVTLGPAWATAEEGECSHHCAIPAPLKSFLALQLFSLFHDLNV